MVQFSNFLTIMLAGSSIVKAQNVRRSAARASAQFEAQDAIASFQKILNTFSNNIGSEEEHLESEQLKEAFQGYMRMLEGVANINQMPANLVSVANATPFKPNWEGAAIGGVGLGIAGLVAGALMGVTTQWTFAGLNNGIKSLTGIDPMELLASGALNTIPLPGPLAGVAGALSGAVGGPKAGGDPMAGMPMAGMPMPKPASAPKPVNPPVVAAPAPQQVSSPGSPAPPALTVPKPPGAPASPPKVAAPNPPAVPASPVTPPQVDAPKPAAAAVPPAPAAPKVPTIPDASPAPPAKMEGMGHSHGGRK